MKISIPSLLVFALLGSGAALAQSPAAPATVPATTNASPARHHHHHAHNPARRAKHLSKKLGLTPDQSARLQPIFADRDQKLQALASDTSLDHKSASRQRHIISQQAQQQLSAILTPAQQEQFNAMKAAHHHGRHSQPPAATPPAA